MHTKNYQVTVVTQPLSAKFRLQKLYHALQERKPGQALLLPVYKIEPRNRKFMALCTVLLGEQQFIFKSSPATSKKLAENGAATLAIDYFQQLTISKIQCAIKKVILFDAENFAAPKHYIISQAPNVMFIFFDSRSSITYEKYTKFTNCRYIKTPITGKDACDIHISYSARMIQKEFKDARFAIATRDHFGSILRHLMMTKKKIVECIESQSDLMSFIKDDA